MMPPLEGRGILSLQHKSDQPLPAGLFVHPNMPSGPGDLRNMNVTHSPPLREEFTVHLTDVSSGSYSPCVQGAFSEEMTDALVLPGAGGWGVGLSGEHLFTGEVKTVSV